MKRRLTTVLAAWVAGVLAFVLLPLLGPVAPAGAATEDFTLNMTSGELWIRDSDEGFPVGLPTTVSGTNTDGQLSDVAFQTPVISFVRDVPDYGTQAFIDAAFSMVEPGSGTINEAGDVVVNVKLTVDLHIVVPILAFPSDCRTTPVNLTLVSTAPYDGESVTVSAPNFSVPEVPPSGLECINEVRGAVNDALAGAGHSLTMTFAGDLTLPVAGEPTVTTMTVSPAAGARVGQEVTLSAAVEPAEEPEEAVELPGSVTFFDGTTNLGTTPLAADGTASLTTAALAAGTRSLHALYSGSPPDWQPSSSPAVSYTVASAPMVSTNLSGGVVIGGPSKNFTISVRNSDLGQNLDNARVDVRIFRPDIGTSLSTVTLSHIVDGVPEQVTLSAASGTGMANARRGSIESDAWAVSPGQERTEALRLTVPSGVGPGPVRIIFDLVTSDGGEDVVLGSATRDVVMTAASRFETSITAGSGSAPPATPRVRQGTLIELFRLTVGPQQGSQPTTGTLSFRVGGRPAQARYANDATLVSWAEMVDLRSAASTYHVVVPDDMALGDQIIEVRYSGDDIYAGSVASWPVTIEPGRGEVYDCIYAGILRGRFVANVTGAAQVSPVGVQGTELAAERVDAHMYMSRTREHAASVGELFFLYDLGILPDATFDFGLSGGGTGRFTTFTQSGNTAMNASGAGDTDWRVDLGGGVGTLPVGHDAGTVLDIGLEAVIFNANDPQVALSISCQPFNETGASVASVTSTGTSLIVEPGEAVRQGDTVELTAQALPISPGVIEFLDGETTVGVAPVDAQGVARVTTDDLPPGTRTLTARYFGNVYPDSISDPVELTVEGIDCFGLAEPGSEAVVRLIYLTVLNRCPDQAGFDYWTGRLDGGATRESVANAIAASHEARKVLVDEAYELMLERRADAGGREFWATRLGQTGSYRDLIGQLGSSAEFRTLAGGTDADVVDRLYDRLLHRSASAADNTFWVGRIETQGIRATVMRMFDLDEPLRTLVGDTYRTIIDRAPTSVERDAGVDLMRNRSDRAALNASVINTNDFYTRAQSFPNVD